jgi:hypothetical protein
MVEKEKMSEIELEIEDSLLFELMKRAHEADLTLNKYIESLILGFLDRAERSQTPPREPFH